MKSMTKIDNIVKLENAQAVIDLDNKIVYPMMENGEPDRGWPCHLDKVIDSWWESLSPEDYEIAIQVYHGMV